ncbi:hypothetical protein AVEN_190762-1 [Araneus ventricosus]|uniref:Uncharacterized protein n=1 Tax=Araneus ventricosus TaxID=182803 RepID=A0A4Y2HSV1_ARAVE|nr:hypothetical protein AVEN_190762-1 [Araneus ventricosus]
MIATTSNSRSKLLHHTNQLINDRFKLAYHEKGRAQIILVFINGTECTLDNHDWTLTDMICTRSTNKADLRWNRVSRLQPSVCETETLPRSNPGAVDIRNIKENQQAILPKLAKRNLGNHSIPKRRIKYTGRNTLLG